MFHDLTHIDDWLAEELANITATTPKIAPKPTRVEYTTEKELSKAVMEALSKYPKVAWACRMEPGLTIYFKQTGEVGMSDIMGVMTDGKMLCIELKTPKGKLTIEQEAFLKKIQNANGVAFVCRHPDDLERYLK